MKHISWALTLLLVGFGLAGVGEGLGVKSKERGDTLSEWFKHLPKWVQLLIFFVLGAICSHLAEWRINDDDPTTVVEAGDNTTVNLRTDADEEHA